MGDADAPANAGASQSLALHEYLGKPFLAGAGKLGYRRHELVDDTFFVTRFQIDVYGRFIGVLQEFS